MVDIEEEEMMADEGVGLDAEDEEDEGDEDEEGPLGKCAPACYICITIPHLRCGVFIFVLCFRRSVHL